MINIGLVGNPNSGKSTLFNVLTKSKQHTGNWPGVTVEKKEGTLKYKNNSYNIIDLPGIYSLSASSEDEVIARDYIIKENPQVIINVIDATNIERNLYLTTQILELEQNVVVALNMIDEANAKGICIDIESLEKKLGVRVVCISALKGQNLDELIETVIECAENRKNFNVKLLDYGNEILSGVNELEFVIKNCKLDYPKRWVALKLLENDIYIEKCIQECGINNIKEIVSKISDRIEQTLDFDPEIIIADKRYIVITNYTKRCVSKCSDEKVTIGDKLDKIITNKYLGIPIFAVIMLILYELTFTIGAGLQEYAAKFIESIGLKVCMYLDTIGTSNIIISFIEGGIFAGVGAVLSFLPLVMVMYFLIGILEDSGYMARAAYVMDRFMRYLGLHGKTFVSMLIGIGCNVPGIMSSRTLENKKDRMIAILINPFVSCGARLPIYLVFIEAFFTTSKGVILFLLYGTGIVIALIVGKVFSKTLFKGEQSYFVMELPKYRIPSIKNITILMLEKAGSFLKKASVVILPMMLVLWFLANYPFGVEEYSQFSILGRIGMFIAPIFKFVGFGTWQAAVSLFTGIVAKESVVATMGMLYATDGISLISAIQSNFTPLSAISFMVFILLYTPCIVTLATIKKETNLKWAIFTSIYTFVVAWISSAIIYNIGLILGFN